MRSDPGPLAGTVPAALVVAIERLLDHPGVQEAMDKNPALYTHLDHIHFLAEKWMEDGATQYVTEDEIAIAKGKIINGHHDLGAVFKSSAWKPSPALTNAARTADPRFSPTSQDRHQTSRQPSPLGRHEQKRGSGHRMK
ncbi:hypothetical protein [Pseudosporangium ferrugineum]|uniref:hypothetical protein n=1 Tax=Pseudosporangium ferrugineum TaxID=439699 RepID=UPI0011B22094|nr:hypothetical protein [Pseudosporangium ferrugineum]